MDFGTLLGLLSGGYVIFWAITESGGNVGLFLNPHPMVIVFGGSSSVTIMKFGIKKFLTAFKVALRAFIYRKHDPETLIKEAIHIAEVAKKEGLLALENIEIKDSFLKKGVALLVDGHDAAVIQKILSKEMHLTVERHIFGQKVFRAIAEAGPSMGMIGTLLGLVLMMSNMKDPKSIGPSMATALLATFYGAVLANMIAIPIAEKLELRTTEERISKALIIDAIMSIKVGLNPRVIEESLKNYLPSSKRSSDKAQAA